jgi:hypothetical protein
VQYQQIIMSLLKLSGLCLSYMTVIQLCFLYEHEKVTNSYKCVIRRVLCYNKRVINKSMKNPRPKPRVLRLFYMFCKRNIVGRSCYLLENCGARRAPFKPYFFLSFILGSLVRKPAFLSAGRSSPSKRSNAREMPWRIAPA